MLSQPSIVALLVGPNILYLVRIYLQTGRPGGLVINPRMLYMLLIVLDREFESHRGEILNYLQIYTPEYIYTWHIYTISIGESAQRGLAQFDASRRGKNGLKFFSRSKCKP